MVEERAGAVLEHREQREPKYFSSDSIVGKKVKNMEGDDIGEISNLRIAWPQGQVVYAVLRYRRVLGMGGKLFAIPLAAMVYRPGDDTFAVNISKQRMDSLDGFPEDNWPREADWNLIEPGRPMAPLSKEEAMALKQMEAPPPEVVTTERVEVPEKPGPREIVTTEEVEVRERPEVPEEPIRREPPAAGMRPTVTEVQTYLQGIQYPAGKQDLLNQAQKNNAPRGVIDTLGKFDEKTYRSSVDVSEEFAGKERLVPGVQPSR